MAAPERMVVARLSDADLAGVDALDLPIRPAPTRGQRVWSYAWPRLAAVLFVLVSWQLLASSGWQSSRVLPGPAAVFGRLWQDMISAIDHIPTVWLRAGRVLGARGFAAYRFIVLPAALPGLLAGIKQGRAFGWRSLMAGELLVAVAGRGSLGVRMQAARAEADVVGLFATMIVILLIGIAVDSVIFARIDAALRKRWGLTVS